MSAGRPADITVVGAGTAGLATAIEAAELGLQVTVVEQSDHLGGTLWQSWAHMSAAGTSLQRKRGIDDDPQRHFDDVMRISNGTADPDLVRRAVDGAAETIEWLLASGFDVDPSVPVVLHFHEAYSVARTYWGRRGGRSVLDVLLPRFERHVTTGTITLLDTTAVLALSRGSGQHIDGVVVERADGTRDELVTPLLVLTSGGYGGNPDLFAQLHGGARLVGPCPPTSTGSVLRAAEAVGAVIRGGELFLPTYGGVLREDSAWASYGLDQYPALTPQTREPWEIHVNRTGRRFVAEDSPSVGRREAALLEQPGLEFWIVYDEGIRAHAPRLFPGVGEAELTRLFDCGRSFLCANTLDDLARAAGIDADGLRRTVMDYNDTVISRHDVLGRQHLPLPIDTAPFYAVRNHGSVLKSPAGLDIDTSLRVLTHDGPFDNLVAVGEVIGGSRLSGKSFVSGMSVTPALTFGRWVARHVVDGEYPRDLGSAS